jgi:hypothetical protein
MSEVRLVGKIGQEELERKLFLAVVDDLGGWTPDLSTVRAPFNVVTALDTRPLDDETLRSFAELLVSAGCRDSASWGPDCMSVHDAFDDVAISLGLADGDAAYEDYVMTNWFDKDPLDEALEWALFHTPWMPSALAVTSSQYATQVERRLADPEGFAQERFSD